MSLRPATLLLIVLALTARRVPPAPADTITATVITVDRHLAAQIPMQDVAPGDFVYAAALTDTDRPVILIDTASFRPLPPATQRFILAHERGHIALGHHQHDRLGFVISDGAARDAELGADCYAVRVSDADAVRAGARFLLAHADDVLDLDDPHPVPRVRVAAMATCATSTARSALEALLRGPGPRRVD